MNTIGVIGMGTMGSAVAGAFRRAGHRVLSDLNGRSSVSIKRAEAHGIEKATGLPEILSKCDIVFSIVPPEQALRVAETVAEDARGRAERPIFIDANAVSPGTMSRLLRVCDNVGLGLVDGGIVGGPPRDGHRPRLYLSGPGSAALEALDGQAFDFRRLDGDVGQASAFKMAYAGLTKGLNALLVNQLLAAQEFGFLDEYRDELAFSQVTLLDSAESTIPRMPADSGRWVAEMNEIAKTLSAIGLPDGFHAGAAEIMTRLAASPF